MRRRYCCTHCCSSPLQRRGFSNGSCDKSPRLKTRATAIDIRTLGCQRRRAMLSVPGQRGKEKMYWLDPTRFEEENRQLPALRAPGMPAQGNALGPSIDRSFGALKGRGVPPPFHGGRYCLGRDTPWRCPRQASSALLARYRGCAFKSVLSRSWN